MKYYYVVHPTDSERGFIRSDDVLAIAVAIKKQTRKFGELDKILEALSIKYKWEDGYWITRGTKEYTEDELQKLKDKKYKELLKIDKELEMLNDILK